MIPRGHSENPEEYGDSESGAALGAAVDADLARIIDAWQSLSADVRSAMLDLLATGGG